jgi:hypothetical protein
VGTWFIKKLNKRGLLQKKKKDGRWKMEPSYLKMKGSRHRGVADGSRSVKKKIGRRIGDDGTGTRRWNLELHERDNKERRAEER